MRLPPAVADVLRTVAPTLAAALAGPFGPLAAGIVTAALRQWLPAGTEKATPAQVTTAVQEHASDEALIAGLQRAELDLQRFEKELPFRFAELEAKDRDSARAASVQGGLSRPLFYAGMGLVALAVLGLIGTVGLGFYVLKGGIVLNSASLTMAPVVFTLLGNAEAALVSIATIVLTFYFGSSASSQVKTAEITGTMRDLGNAVAERAKLPPPVPVVLPIPAPQEPVEGDWDQGPYGGQRWRLTPLGVVLEGETQPLRTVGQPITIRRIWQQYGAYILEASAAERVPLELIAACIAAESGGKWDVVAPDGGIGLMQLMPATAAEVSRITQPTVAGIKEPQNNILLGTRYIAKQREKSDFNPPLVAAAYNAGGLYPLREGVDDNPWNLRSTGDHITRFCRYYGDACFVAHADGWGLAKAA